MSNNKYYIKYASMDKFYIEICNRACDWNEQLSAWQETYKLFNSLESFSGQSAKAVKTYFEEVHGFLIAAIRSAVARYQSELLMYKSDYYNIESNIYASISQDVIKSVEKRLADEVRSLSIIHEEIKRKLDSIKDIYWNGRPTNLPLETHMKSAKDIASKLNSDIEKYESEKCRIADGELRELLQSLKSFIASYYDSATSISTYKSGDIRANLQALDLAGKVQENNEYIQTNQEHIQLAAQRQEEVYTQMRKDYEEALKAREEYGMMNLIGGAVIAGIGAVVIFATGGTATPVVVTGLCSVAYGTSNMVEGGQDMYYASVGNLDTVAVNPLRDTVFMGSQTAYDVWGNVSMSVAIMYTPAAYAAKSATAAGKSAVIATGKTVGKEYLVDAGVDYVSSSVTNYATQYFGLSQPEAALFNMGLSVLGEKRVDSGISRLNTKIHMPNTSVYINANNMDSIGVKAVTDVRASGIADVNSTVWDFTGNKSVTNHVKVDKVPTDSKVELKEPETAPKSNMVKVDQPGTDINNVTKPRVDEPVTPNKVMGVGSVSNGAINSYSDFSKEVSSIGMRSDLSDSQKIYELQKVFEISNYKTDINVPSDIQYVRGFDAKGNVIYNWPPKLGFEESTIKSISRTDGLPDVWDRYGYMGGSNFADVPLTGKYTYSERAIPYIENEDAYHTGTFNNASYFDKIDAIKNGDMVGLNTILSEEGIENVDSSYFYNLQNAYNDFVEDTIDSIGSEIDVTYGLKGKAAAWGDLSGGAGQYVTPLNGNTMKRLGIIK